MNEKILPKEYLSGVLKTGEISLECYVLDNGMRAITKRGMQKALGIPASKSGTILENFLLSYKSYNIKPQNFAVIESGFKNVAKFQRKGAGGSQPDSMAFEATFLMDVCHFIQDLKQYCTIPPEWDYLYKNATIIERAFSKLGIIAYIDEATGYIKENNIKEAQEPNTDSNVTTIDDKSILKLGRPYCFIETNSGELVPIYTNEESTLKDSPLVIIDDPESVENEKEFNTKDFIKSCLPSDKK